LLAILPCLTQRTFSRWGLLGNWPGSAGPSFPRPCGGGNAGPALVWSPKSGRLAEARQEGNFGDRRLPFGDQLLGELSSHGIYPLMKARAVLPQSTLERACRAVELASRRR
jgi:hypothetical protein